MKFEVVISACPEASKVIESAGQNADDELVLKVTALYEYRNRLAVIFSVPPLNYFVIHFFVALNLLYFIWQTNHGRAYKLAANAIMRTTHTIRMKQQK